MFDFIATFAARDYACHLFFNLSAEGGRTSSGKNFDNGWLFMGGGQSLPTPLTILAVKGCPLPRSGWLLNHPGLEFRRNGAKISEISSSLVGLRFFAKNRIMPFSRLETLAHAKKQFAYFYDHSS